MTTKNHWIIEFSFELKLEILARTISIKHVDSRPTDLTNLTWGIAWGESHKPIYALRQALVLRGVLLRLNKISKVGLRA